MSWLRRLRVGLRGLLRRTRVEAELDEELEFHFEREIEEQLRLGRSEAEARRLARLAIPGVARIKDECRDQSDWIRLQRFLADLRFGARVLSRSPVFATVTVTVLALGIGAATAVFSLVNGVLLRPLPYPDPDRLIRIFETAPVSQGGEIRSVANPTVADWIARTRAFEGIAAYGPWSVDLTGGDRPEQLPAAMGSARLFRLLGVEPQLGRLFAQDEELPGGPRAVLLSHQLWRDRYGADPALLGKSILLNRQPFTVIGVMPSGFDFPAGALLWSSLAVDHEFDARQARHLSVLARLAPGVTIAAAEADLLAAERDLAGQFPRNYTGFGVGLIALKERMVGEARPMLMALFGAVSFFLLIACANVANLLLARAVAREREVAVRLALGASRSRLVQQFLVEFLLLFGAATALGLLAASWVVGMVRAVGPADIPRLDGVGIDLEVAACAILTVLITGLLFGLIPALRGSNPDLIRSLKSAGALGTTRTKSLRLRGGLTVAETAIATTLLVGAGLLVRSLDRLARVDAGLPLEGLLTFHIGLPPERAQDNAFVVSFFQQVGERLEAIPEVVASGMTSRLPLSGSDHSTSFRLEGDAADPGSERSAQDRVVTPGYFRALGIPVLRGREFTEDDRSDGVPVVMVNQGFARRFFPGADPVGQSLMMGGRRAIVGVVGDTRQFSLDLPAEPELYMPHAQRPWPWLSVAVRTRSDPRGIVNAVRQAVESLDPDMPVTAVRTIDELASAGIAQRRLLSQVLGGFAGAAFLLAALGLYGVIAYQVTLRVPEIGVRMAFGATRTEVIRLVLLRGARLLAAGTLIGLMAAFLLAGTLRRFLFETTPADPLTYAAIAGLLMVVGLAACVIPARRAAGTDPVSAMRAE